MYRFQNDKKFIDRKHPRLKNYDYSTENYYFVTICTHEKKCIFGFPKELNKHGKIAQMGIENIPVHYEGVEVQKFVIMPNHVHMIIALEDANISISYLIALLKTSITKQIRRAYPSMQVWQRSFHDHIIRNEEDYQRIWSYIDTNPILWELDCFYVDNRAD